MSVAVGKDLEVGDGIGDALKGRICEPNFGAEVEPIGPMGRGLVGSCRNDAMGAFVCCSEEVTAESRDGRRWKRRQGRA
eukprot:scaffold22879_cov191-Cylindrotheca_fusiformis.AAC.3